MVTASIAGMTIGLVLIMVAAATRKEKWRLTYAVVGLIFIFYSLQFFQFGRLDQNLLPALTMLFGLFSFYTKGSAQLIAILTTLVLFFQIAIP
jgi:hypothetical protein